MLNWILGFLVFLIFAIRAGQIVTSLLVIEAQLKSIIELKRAAVMLLHGIRVDVDKLVPKDPG